MTGVDVMNTLRKNILELPLGLVHNAVCLVFLLLCLPLRRPLLGLIQRAFSPGEAAPGHLAP